MSLLNQANSTPSTDLPQSGSIYSVCSSMTTVYITGCHNTADWILKSGATDHITCQSKLLINKTSCEINISLPNGQVTIVYCKGTVMLTPEIILSNVLLIPEFQFNLIYVSKLSKTLKYEAHFNAYHCIIQAPMKRVMGIGKLHGNLYKLILPKSSHQHMLFTNHVSVSASSQVQDINNL